VRTRAGTRRPRRGFTLLEVMVAMSILALALVAVAGTNANSFEASNYARHITVATMLARSKMLDVELELQKDGFSENDKEDSGDFSEEGFEELKWTVAVRKVEVDVNQLLGGFLGGDVSPEELPQQMQTFIQGMSGTAPDQAINDQVANSDLQKMLGGGQLETVFKQVGETLGDSIREITIEITWGRKDIDFESVKFVQYVTTTGRLNVPQAAGSAADALNQALTPGGRPPVQGGFIPPHPPRGAPQPGGQVRLTMRSSRSQRGLTLMEVALAVSILAIIATLTWGSIARSFDAYEAVTEIDRNYHNVRVAMNRMSKELSSAFIASARRSKGPERRVVTHFRGEAASPFHELHFTAFAHDILRADAKEGDSCEISYFGAPDPDKPNQVNLMRREDPRIDDEWDEGGRAYVLAEDVKEFKLRFWDERREEWTDEWDTEKSDLAGRLPPIVEITMVILDENGKELKFVTKARVNLTRELGTI
jgi:general secretion pathway protein J